MLADPRRSDLVPPNESEQGMSARQHRYFVRHGCWLGKRAHSEEQHDLKGVACLKLLPNVTVLKQEEERSRQKEKPESDAEEQV